MMCTVSRCESTAARNVTKACCAGWNSAHSSSAAAAPAEAAKSLQAAALRAAAPRGCLWAVWGLLGDAEGRKAGLEPCFMAGLPDCACMQATLEE